MRVGWDVVAGRAVCGRRLPGVAGLCVVDLVGGWIGFWAVVGVRLRWDVVAGRVFCGSCLPGVVVAVLSAVELGCRWLDPHFISGRRLA